MPVQPQEVFKPVEIHTPTFSEVRPARPPSRKKKRKDDVSEEVRPLRACFLATRAFTAEGGGVLEKTTEGKKKKKEKGKEK